MKWACMAVNGPGPLVFTAFSCCFLLYTLQAIQEILKANKLHILRWPNQSPDLNPVEHAFHLLQTRLKTERLTHKQQLKAPTVKGW